MSKSTPITMGQLASVYKEKRRKRQEDGITYFRYKMIASLKVPYTLSEEMALRFAEYDSVPTPEKDITPLWKQCKTWLKTLIFHS